MMECYSTGYGPSQWVIDDLKKEPYGEPFVIYKSQSDDHKIIEKLAENREPTNLTMNRLYNKVNLFKHFNYMTGYYGEAVFLHSLYVRSACDTFPSSRMPFL